MFAVNDLHARTVVRADSLAQDHRTYCVYKPMFHADTRRLCGCIHVISFCGNMAHTTELANTAAPTTSWAGFAADWLACPHG